MTVRVIGSRLYCEHTLFFFKRSRSALRHCAGAKVQDRPFTPTSVLGRWSERRVLMYLRFLLFWNNPLLCTPYYAHYSKWRLTGRNVANVLTNTCQVLEVWTQQHFEPVSRHYFSGPLRKLLSTGDNHLFKAIIVIFFLLSVSSLIHYFRQWEFGSITNIKCIRLMFIALKKTK